MHTQVLGVVDVALYLAEELERILPLHYEFDYEMFWEIMDCGFLDFNLQNYGDNDLYEHYSQYLPTDIVSNIFIRVLCVANNLLDRKVSPNYRKTPPTTVNYLGAGNYQLFWSSLS